MLRLSSVGTNASEPGADDVDHAEFWVEALPYAEQAHNETGLFTSLILSQWADETAYGGPDWSPRNNPGNVGDPEAGGQTTFPTLQAGVNEYVHLMNTSPQFGPRVRTGITPQIQAYLLGSAHPVWALAGYNDGHGPGSALVEIMTAYDLTQFDAPRPGPAPVPPAPSTPLEATMLATCPTGGLWVAGSDGGVFAENCEYFGSLPGLKVVPAHPVTGIAATPTGKGYWLCDQGGGLYALGDAVYAGNILAQVAKSWVPCVGVAADPGGYTMVQHLTNGVPILWPIGPADPAEPMMTISAVELDGLEHHVTAHPSLLAA